MTSGINGQLTTAGLARLAANGLTSTCFSHIAVGTGAATFALGMVAMGAELKRKAVADVTTPGSNMNARMFLSNNEGVGTLTEAGLWDALAAGNLLAYYQFVTSEVKASTAQMLVNFIVPVRNLKTAPILTAGGLAAFAAHGFTQAAFPFIGVGTGRQQFRASLVAMQTELVRVATSVAIVGAVATYSGTFATAASNGAWTEVGLWSAASGGTLLAYISQATPYYTKTGGSHVCPLALTLANGA